jgi:hypothetical protein
VFCMWSRLCARSWTVGVLLLVAFVLPACAGEAARSGVGEAATDRAIVEQGPDSGFAAAEYGVPDVQSEQDDFGRKIVKTA